MNKEAKVEEKSAAKPEAKEKLAVIRIRGERGVKKDIDDTLTMLRLYRKHFCVIVPKTASYSGMLKKAKDYITYGEIDPETEKELIEKRGGDKEGKGFFRLHPPRKGFERKGIKRPFTVGGALGYRGKKINELIKRML